MSIYRPGGLSLTQHALELSALKPGQKLLDVGCGDGESAVFASKHFGLKVTAIDKDPAAVARAKEQGAIALRMDASSLSYPSRCFDAVMMECVFTALDRQEEALHEAYCILRPGGILIISDLYCRQPDMDRWRKDYREAMALFRRPRNEGDCESSEHLPSPYCQDGALVLDGLYYLLDELEMEIMVCEDRTEDLKTFLAQAIMECGSVETWFDKHGGWKPCTNAGKNTGYFLLLARKKNA